MSKLGRAPYGYLGALDLKALGQNPDEILDKITGSLELAPYYNQPLVVKINSSAPGAGVLADGTQLALTVPDGKAWLCYSLSGALGIGVGDTIRDQMGLMVGYRPAAPANDLALAVGEQYAPRVIVGGQTLRTAVTWDAPLLFPSGSLLIVRTTGSVNLLAPGALVVAALVFEFST